MNQKKNSVNFRSKLRAFLLGTAVLVIGQAVGADTGAFTLSSPDFAAGQLLNTKFTFNGLDCTGQNISPALSWANPPEGTKSFALMVHDPDAITGGAGIWHWVIVNIPADSRGVVQGAGTKGGEKLPAGTTQVPTVYGSIGWGGPCPRPGTTHHYNFTIYALKVARLEFPPNSTASHVGFLVNLASLGKATLSAAYHREK